MKKYTKYTGNEEGLQMSAAAWLNFKGILWCHPPNGGQRNRTVGAKLKRQGTKPGVPDILIFEPRGKYHGFMIELKAGTNTTQPNQKKWLKSLENRGYKVLVSYSLDEVIDEVNKYLEL